jgi:hypothetical protein
LQGFRSVIYYWPRRKGYEELVGIVASHVKKRRVVSSYIL